jgi:hypothetical protein
MKNINGTYVGIYMSLLSCLATQSFVACYRSGIVQIDNIITSKKWPKQVSLIPGQKNVVIIPLINPEKFIYLCCTSRQWIKIGLDLCILKISFPQ